uniref:Uncharacterized protein n=1 Tax=viral metagenome TaxID=1070528 RepID=A0A6C0KUG1_9ZZZZ
MLSYFSIPVVKDDKIVYKRIPVPSSSDDIDKIVKNTDVDFLTNQLDNFFVDTSKNNK